MDDNLVAKASNLKICADTNAVPPTGIAGVDAMDNVVEMKNSSSGCYGIGALAIGNIKYKSQHECLKLMHDSDKPYIYILNMLLNLLKKCLMSKAVVLVSSDTSYLEHQLSLLNYTSYPIDEYNHKNIHKLYDLRFINDFIKDILLKHSNPFLIYGSGLEDKQKIYDLLTNNFIVKGNNLNMLSSFSDLRIFKSTFEKHNFKIPDDFDNDILNGKIYMETIAWIWRLWDQPRY